MAIIKRSGEHFKRVQRGFLYAICELRNLTSGRSCNGTPDDFPDDTPRGPLDSPTPNPPRTTPVNPGDHVAVPGNTNRQRLGISSRPVGF